MSMKSDPNGIDQHAPGAKLDAGKVRPSLILGPMARALLAVAEVGTYGANKYSDGGWQHVPDALKRYTDARDRHQLFEAIEADDSESGLKHAAHAAWNALARLELILRDEAASEQCGQVEAQEEAANNLPDGYSWDDAPEDFEWMATDREGAFWFCNEPEVGTPGEVWAWQSAGCKTIDDYPKKMEKYQRPTSTAK